MLKNVFFFVKSINIYLDRYIQELYNMREKAMIPNTTSSQLQLTTKRKAPNICQALDDSSELCYLKLIRTAYEMAQVQSMLHRWFHLSIKI